MSRNRYNTNVGYNYGSTAPNIDYDQYQPQIKKVPNDEISRVQRNIEKGKELRRKLVIISCILSVFGTSAAFVWGCAVVSHKQYELKQTKSEVRQLKSQINTTRALIASATNLDHIKDRAINELDMTEPLPHQIIQLDIPKTSYTVIGQE